MPPHGGPHATSRSLTWRWDVNTLTWVVWDGSLSVGSVTIGTVLQGSPPWTMDLIRVGGAALTEGQKAMAASIPVVVAIDQSALPVTGPLTDAQLRATPVPVSGTVTANAGTNLNTSALALETGGNLAAIKADVDKIPNQGQALAAASMPVVLTATQITTLTPPAAITGFALETTQSAQSTLIGAVTETAPASDTASSGLNGRLQRIAQRITSLIALFPAALGAGGGLKVDGSGTTLPVSGTVTATGPLTDTQLRASAVPVLQNLSLPAHDYISLAYTGVNLTTVVFKTGGSGGATVATLTLAYSGAVLTSVTKS